VGSNPASGMDVWCVYVYSVFVLPCVWVEALRRVNTSSKESYRLCKDQETSETSISRIPYAPEGAADHTKKFNIKIQFLCAKGTVRRVVKAFRRQN
jgi:hypothetical protein